MNFEKNFQNNEIPTLESFTEPFGEHEHTVHVTSMGELMEAAKKLKNLGYTWNGGRDLLDGLGNEFTEKGFMEGEYTLRLVVEDNVMSNPTQNKVVTWIKVEKEPVE